MRSAPSSPSARRLLSLPEASRQAGCSVQTLRRLVERGLLPATDVGAKTQRAYRIAPGDLTAFLAGRRARHGVDSAVRQLSEQDEPP